VPVAEIETQRKGPSVWPWIIGLIVLALLVWALAELFTGGGEPVVPADQRVPSGAVLVAPPSPVEI
jgi:hypothetical protein